MKKILSTIGLMVVAIAVFVGGVWIEKNSTVEAATALEQEVIASSADTYTVLRDGFGEEVSGRKKLIKGDEVRAGGVGSVIIKFDDNGEIRLAQDSAVAYSGLYENGYVFTVKGGRVWSNNLYTTSGLNILAGGSILIPRKATVDIGYNGGNTVISSVRGQVYVGLVGDDYVVNKVVDARDDMLINSFLVAQGGRSEISYSKVIQNKDILARLLYSKLIKEFKYSLFNKDLLVSDLWISQNIKKDNELTIAVEDLKNGKITNRNLKYASLDSIGYQLNQTLNNVGDKLTFVESKQQTRLKDHIFDNILDAEYLLVYGRKIEAEERIKVFKSLFVEQLNNGDKVFKDDLVGMTQREYDRLNFVIPGHPLAEVKTVLSDLLITYGGGNDIEYKLAFVRNYMNYAYYLTDTDVLAARISLDTYFSKLRDLLKDAKADKSYLAVLMAEENQIMDNLLKQYPEFYSDSVFAMKSFVETELLKLIADNESKKEEKQSMISTKIDFLKSLQNYFLKKDVTLEDSRAIALRLVNEIRDMQAGNEVAVNELFALRLQDYGTFLRFLNTTNVSTLRGASPQSKYTEFLNSQEEQVSIEQAINEFVGIAEGEGSSTDAITGDIKADFAAVGILDITLSPLGSTEQKVVGIERGSYMGVEFNGLYDWSRKLLLEVNVKGETVNQASIRLNSLPLVLEAQKNAPAVAPVDVTPATTSPVVKPAVKVPTAEDLSKAEKVARILFIQKLKSNGITVVDANIVIQDVDKQLYAVKNGELTSDGKIKISFGYDNRNDVVTGLVVTTENGLQVTEGSFVLKDLEKEAVNLVAVLTE